MNNTRKGSGHYEIGRYPGRRSYSLIHTLCDTKITNAIPSQNVMQVRDKILNIYINKMRQDQVLAQNQKPTVPIFFDYAMNHPLPEEAIQIILQKKSEESFSLVEVLENLPIPLKEEKRFLDNITSKMPKELLEHYNSDYASFVEQFKPVPVKKKSMI